MKYLLLQLILLITLPVLSQTKVSGVVYDTNGETLPFVNVLFKDSHEGTITDENGKFYLESKSSYSILLISYLGFTPKEIPLTSPTTYNLVIELEEETAQLNEVVIYAGNLSKKDNPAIDILRKKIGRAHV